MPGKLAVLRVLLGATLLALAACGSDAPPPTQATSAEEATVSSIEGEVFYRERMMLPPGAEVEVQLQDISRADALATVMATVMQRPESGPPYPFAIEYDPETIDPRMRYALRATISLGEKLLFTSTEYIDPFAGNPLRIMVQRVAEPVDRAAGVEQPVAGAGQGADASDTSAVAVWELETLSGEPAATGAGGNPAQLLLNAADSSVAGFSGCNRYSGTFASEGNSDHGTPIRFSPLATTMRACAEGSELERAYLAMLGSVDAYRLQGAGLQLMQGDQVLATFRLRE